MECKTVPKIPETTVDLITQLDRKRGTSCSRYGFKLCLGILSCLCLAYCIYLHYSYINLLKQLQNIQENSESSNQPEAMVKRQESEFRRLRRNGRRRRELQNLKNKVKDLETLPMVHLTGNKTFGTTDSHRACPAGQPCFLWKYPSYYRNQIEYMYVDGKVVGIKITRAGYYYVYSQISVGGLKNEENVPYNPAFGYETIKVNNRGSTVLSKSFVTQDERGQWYDYANKIAPLDTINQMGIFRLNCQDIIMLRSAEHLNNDNIKFLQNQFMSYFGLMLLRPANGLDNNSCF